MWVLVTKYRAELRCYACPHKPRKVLTDYSSPTRLLNFALSCPTQTSVASIVYAFIEDCMAASASNGKMKFYKYDYDSNIWRDDQYYLHELISNPEGQLWTAFNNMNVTTDAEEKARSKLLIQIGTFFTSMIQPIKCLNCDNRYSQFS
ncbi:MAG: hypothetical protein EOP45_12955 [Sphingobacteriaceae bacterium]|nr:MAG: hypothetical protein EOP45_12955 [Sphingobacteriaceae bacterium]